MNLRLSNITGKRLVTAIMVATLIAVVVLPIKSFAQNNRLHMADDLYKEYLEADKKHFTAEGVKLAENLYRKATKRRDKNARCAALSIPLYYYRNSKDSVNFYNAANKMKQVAKEVKLPKYYYFAWRRLINNMLNYGKSRDALQEALKMQKELKGKDEQNSYDIAQCFSIIGNIYFVRQDFATAEKFFTEGLNYARAKALNQDLTPFYQYLYAVNNSIGNYRKALNYTEEGLKRTKREHYIKVLTICKTVALYRLNRLDEFRRNMKEIDKFVAENGVSAYSTYKKLKIYEAIIDKRYDDARALANKIGTKTTQAELLKEISKNEGKWKEAYDYEKTRAKFFSLDIESMKNNDLASLNAEFVNARLKADSAKLQTDFTQALLKGELTENARLRAETERNKQLMTKRDLTIRNYALADSLKTIELLNHKEKSKLIKLDAEKQAIRASFKNIALAIGVITLLAVVVLVLVMLNNSRKYVRKLTAKDERLKASLEKAKESERMKTIFVDNISTVISEPLKSIVDNLEKFNNNQANDKQTADQSLANMHDGTARLTSLVNEMLAIANEDSNTTKTNSSTTGTSVNVGITALLLMVCMSASPQVANDDTAYWHKALTEEEQKANVYERQLSQQQSLEMDKMKETYDNEQLKAQNQSLKLASARKRLETEQTENKRLAIEAENDRVKITNKDLSLKQLKATDSLKSSELKLEKAKYQLAKSVAEHQLMRTQRLQRLLAVSLGAMVIIALFLVLLLRKAKKHVVTLIHKDRELVKAKEEIEKSNAEKAAFINNVSHEIRTPLNAIIGFTEIIADGGMYLTDDDKKEYTAIINKNADLLSTMVDNIVLLSKLQAGKITPENKDININKLCRQSLNLLRDDCPKDIELAFTTKVSDSETLNTDGRLLTIVIVHLLSNSLKFTQQGKITLSCAKANERLVIAVEDTGCGIPKDKQTTVFEAFNKVDIYKQGIGVGLNICKLIADLLHSEICVDEKYINGTRIYLTMECCHAS